MAKKLSPSKEILFLSGAALSVKTILRCDHSILVKLQRQA
jgi:hypothetical protein